MSGAWSIAVVAAILGAACSDDVVVSADDGRDASEVASHDATTWTLPDAVDSGRLDATDGGVETTDGATGETSQMGAGIDYALGATTLSGPRGNVRVTWIIADGPRLRWGF